MSNHRSTQPHSPGRVGFALAVACGLLVPAVAVADPEVHFKAGWKAYETGNFPEALKMAEDGYAEKSLTKLMYLKAIATWKLGHLGEAWTLLQLVKPRELPTDMQDHFLTDYETLERAVKEAKAKDAAADEQRKEQKELAKERRHEVHEKVAARNSRGVWLSIVGGVLILAGAGDSVSGVVQAGHAGELDLTNSANHAGYKKEMSLARVEYYSGFAIATLGAGVLAWGLIDLMAEVPKEYAEDDHHSVVHPPGTRLQPWLAPDVAGVLLAGRF